MAYRPAHEIREHINQLNKEIAHHEREFKKAHNAGDYEAREWHRQSWIEKYQKVKELKDDLKPKPLEEEEMEHEKWHKLGDHALENAKEAKIKGRHDLAKELEKSAEYCYKEANNAKDRLHRRLGIMEEVGYDNLDNEGKYEFHVKAMKQAEINYNRAPNKQAADEMNKEHRYHWEKATVYKKLLDMGIKDI